MTLLTQSDSNCGHVLRVALWLLLSCALGAAASDWPCYRGPHGDGVIAESVAPAWPEGGPRKLWSVPLRDDGAGTHAGASIVAGRVYVPGKTKEGDVESDVIYCFDAGSGAEVWRYAYVAAGRNDEVYGTGIRIQPTVDEERVYTIGCYGQLVCLNRDSGKLLWRRDLLEEFNGKPPSFGMSAAPLVAGELLICETGGSKAVIAALDRRTGKTVWEGGDDGASYATPQTATFGGVEQVVVFLASGLSGFELKSGRALWNYPYPDERRKNVPAPIIDVNRIYIANNSLGFNALEIVAESGGFSAKKLWSSRGAKMHFSCPVIGAAEDACLYFHDGKREVKCLALANGALKWGAPNMGREEAVLVRMGAHQLLAAPDSGEIVLLRVSATGCEETGRFRAFDSREKLYVQPSIADGRLFVRDHATLACYDLRAEQTVAGTPAKVAAQHAALAGPDNRLDAAQAWRAKRSLFLIAGLTGALLAVLGTWLLSRRKLSAGILSCEAAALGLALVVYARALHPEDVKAALVRHNWLHGVSAEKEAALALAMLAALAVWLGLRRGSRALWPLCAVAALLAVPLAAIQFSGRGSADISYILFSLEVRDTRSGLNNLVTIAGLLVLFFAAVKYARLEARPWGNWVYGAAAVLLVGLTCGTSVQICGGLFSAAAMIFPALTMRALGLPARSMFLSAAAAAVLTLAAMGTALAVSEHWPPAALCAALLAGGWLCAEGAGVLLGRGAVAAGR